VRVHIDGCTLEVLIFSQLENYKIDNCKQSFSL